VTQRSNDYGVRVIYSDVDGTMVGPQGCFFRSEDRDVTLEPASALGDMLKAGIDLVLISGRSEAQLLEACAIFGADGYVAELGAVVGWHAAAGAGRKQHLLRGAMPEQFDAIPDELVEGMFGAFARKLEFHAPWHLGHRLDVMVRGQVDVAAVNAWFADQGAAWVRLHDNGLLPPRPTPGLDVDQLHVYHLVPDGIDKGRAVAFDLARRGLTAEQAIAIGDSASDLAMAPHVGRFHLVSNGARSASVRARAQAATNVVIEDTALGLGWASAVRSVLTRSTLP
jgi:hydroxymethylpyrimidine pyrophosphatase-like HAD family hydrolase